MNRTLQGETEQFDPYSFDLDGYEAIDYVQQFMAYLAKLDTRLLGEQGTEFSYSNDPYALLGAFIEHISGMPYEQYVKQHILDPAGMTRSVFLPAEAQELENVAKLYTRSVQNGESNVYASPR